MARGAHVLVVEDEPAIMRAVATNLSAHGFDVETASGGEAGIEAYGRRRPDVIILDLGLPDIDGSEVIRQVRAVSGTPIIVLSVRGAEREKVEALDLGADDYLTKPFGVDELLARVRVALRHSARPSAGAEPVFHTGELEVDLERRIVRLAGQEVHLTPTEYRLLQVFIAQPDKLLTDRMLLQAAWGPEYGDEAHYLHVYVARLRKKIEPDPQRPLYLVTEPGVGYRLVTMETEPSTKL
jgi:two-component system, OmpR family, KDP operon response regulator KdpE